MLWTTAPGRHMALRTPPQQSQLFRPAPPSVALTLLGALIEGHLQSPALSPEVLEGCALWASVAALSQQPLCEVDGPASHSIGLWSWTDE